MTGTYVRSAPRGRAPPRLRYIRRRVLGRRLVVALCPRRCYHLGIAADARIGTELAGYRIERLLGRGGMGAVYLAEDTALGRRVALKLLSSELADDRRFRERFLRESRLAASLDHPNIVPVYQAGDVEGVLFIAMRYVAGTDLRELLARESPLPPGRALALLEQVADALDAAHEHGLVHRDVKPGNILVARRGTREHCYLADFGLTKQASSISGLTMTGQLVGTVDYLAPEQVRGQSVDGRADQYSLACVLYECLAGEPPFTRENEVATLWAHVNDDPPKLTHTRSDLRRDIDAVLGRALAKEPDARFATCSDLVTAARAALAVGAPHPARGRLATPPRLSDAARTVARRRLEIPAVALLGIVAVLFLAAVVAAIVLTRDGGGTAAPAAPAVEPNSIVRFDPTTKRVSEVVPVGRGPGQLALTQRALWVVNEDVGTLTRVDRRTREPETIAGLAGACDAATDETGAVWIAGCGARNVVRLDARTGRVRQTVNISGDATSLVVAGGALWVATITPGTGDVVTRVDLRTRRTRTFEVADEAFLIAASDTAVFAGGGSRALSRISLFSDQVDEIEFNNTVAGLAADISGVWVATVERQSVWRLDKFGGVMFTLAMPGRPEAIAVDDRRPAVYVTIPDARALVRITPKTRTVYDVDTILRVPPGLEPRSVAVREGEVWLTVGRSA